MIESIHTLKYVSQDCIVLPVGRVITKSEFLKNPPPFWVVRVVLYRCSGHCRRLNDLERSPISIVHIVERSMKICAHHYILIDNEELELVHRR